MRPLVLAAALVALAASASGMELFDEDDKVQVIQDKKTLQAEVLSSRRAVLLGAFSDDPQECEGCSAVSKEFKKAAETLAGYGVLSVAVDCTGSLPKCKGMSQLLGLRNMPGIVGLIDPPEPNPYTHKPDRAKLPFEGAAMARGLQKHVLNKIPSVLLDRMTEDTWPPPPSHSSASSVVLLFTDRESTSPLYRALAFHYGPYRLKFAEVSSEEEALKEKFGVTTFPTLLVVPASSLVAGDSAGSGGAGDAAVYDGSLKDWQSMTSFLDSHALPDTDDNNLAGDADKSGSDDGSKGEKGKSKSKASPAMKKDDNNGLVASQGSVLVDSPQAFKATVTQSSDAWVVLFHDDGLGSGLDGSGVDGDGDESATAAAAASSKETVAVSAWSEVAAKCDQGLVSAAEVNCTASKELCAMRKVKFSKKGPSAVVHVYGYGDKEDLEVEDDVMGGGGGDDGALEVFPAAEAGAALVAAGDSLPDLTLKVNAMTLDHVMSEAASQKGLVLVLVSNKNEPPAMLKQLALTLQGAASVCFFPDPDQQTLTKFQITRTPMFVVLFAQPKEEEGGGGSSSSSKNKNQQSKEIAFGIQHFNPKMYGRPTFESVFSFALQMFGQVNPEQAQAVMEREQDKLLAISAGGKTKAKQQQRGGGAGSSGGASGSGGQGGGSSGQQQLGVIPEVTFETWSDLCKPSSATLCAVAFFSGPKESPTFESEMAALQSAQAARTQDPYVFMWANGNCLLDFADAFDVQPSKVPTVVAYSPKKSRYASFIGVYGEEPINDLLTGVLSGRVSTKTLYQAAVPDQGKDCSALFKASSQQGGGGSEGGSGSETTNEEEEEEDLGDMMAEILAEEARAKEALAAEVEADAKAAKEEAKAAADAELAKAEKAKKKKAAKKKAAKKKKKSGKKDNEL